MDQERKVYCICKRIHCKRHGNCEECIAYHAKSTKYPLPVCRKLKKKSSEEKRLPGEK